MDVHVKCSGTILEVTRHSNLGCSNSGYSTMVIKVLGCMSIKCLTHRVLRRTALGVLGLSVCRLGVLDTQHFDIQYLVGYDLNPLRLRHLPFDT